MQRAAAALCCAALFAFTTRPVGALEQALPEAAVPAASATPSPTPSPGRHFHRAVATAHPLASEAGLRMLQAGGSAVDAAVAVQAVLGLVEPQSSGLGGGAFLVLSDHDRLLAWDGRETAPAAVHEDLFLDASGAPLPFDQAVPGGRSVGVPGVLRMLEAAHRRHGRLPWARLFAPAIALADGGFPISARLAGQIADDRYLTRDPVAKAYFFDAEGRPWPAGHLLRNPEYAAMLRAIAQGGSTAFHTGAIARAIVHTVRSAATPGALAAEDLAGYRAVRREVLCFPWQAVRVCGMPPPSAGLLVTAQVLGLLQAANAFPPVPAPAPLGHLWTPGFTHHYIEAARLAQADRDQYIADPDRTPPPPGGWSRFWAADYLAQRARLIDEQAAPTVLPGKLGGRVAWAADRSGEVPATTHFSIADGRGQVLAMTSSIESQFGARLMVNRGHGLPGGFLLNNQLTDFSFVPRRDGRPVANRVAPGKRPRSSMSPTLVLEAQGPQVIASLGSPGGPLIPHYVVKALIDWRLGGASLQQAFDAPNVAPLGPSVEVTLIERGRWPETTLEALRGRGHRLRDIALPSGLQGLTRLPDGRWEGAADTRREGTVAGD